MSVIISVVKDFIGFFSVKTKHGRIRFLLLAVVLVGLALFLSSGSDEESEELLQMRSVQTALIANFSEDSAVELIGTVAAIDQAVIQSEASGRVVSISTTLGSPIAAGAVIAQLENASEYASLLQAQGSYEAALVAAQTSDISVTEAQNSQENTQTAALNTYRSAYTTISDVLVNTVDNFYGNPDNQTPGVRINVPGSSDFPNNERVAFKTILSSWLTQSNSLRSSDDLITPLTNAIADTRRLIALTDLFIAGINAADATETLDGALISSYFPALNAERAVLTSTLSSLESQIIALNNAEELVRKATLGGTEGDFSSANAQLKQALGSLKAAEANYAKTILRSPISGVVNVLDLKTGDFVNASQKIAEIANNDALEVTTFVGQSDRDLISLNQSVLLEGTIEGIISNIAPVVNTATGKIEVKIQSTSPDLVNGDTVVVSLQNATSTSSQGPSTISVPLTAVKFSIDAGSVYTVEDGVIVSHPVTVGAVRNIFIEIPSGLTSDMEIVVDARGLSEGEKVTVISK